MGRIVIMCLFALLCSSQAMAEIDEEASRVFVDESISLQEKERVLRELIAENIERLPASSTEIAKVRRCRAIVLEWLQRDAEAMDEYRAILDNAEDETIKNQVEAVVLSIRASKYKELDEAGRKQLRNDLLEALEGVTKSGDLVQAASLVSQVGEFSLKENRLVPALDVTDRVLAEFATIPLEKRDDEWHRAVRKLLAWRWVPSAGFLYQAAVYVEGQDRSIGRRTSGELVQMLKKHRFLQGVPPILTDQFGGEGDANEVANNIWHRVEMEVEAWRQLIAQFGEEAVPTPAQEVIEFLAPEEAVSPDDTSRSERGMNDRVELHGA